MAAKRAKAEEKKGGGTPAWMVTYGDMMTLLLTFFVLILSFSTIQEAGFKSALGSLKGALGVLDPRGADFVLETVIHPPKFFAFLENRLRQTTGEISEDFNFISQLEGLEMTQDDKGLHIVLPANVLFASGSADLREESFLTLRKLGAFIYENRSEIIVEGHTDNVPIRSPKYPSNWELSVGRSVSVMRFLNANCGVPYQNISVAGYGEFNPIASNDTPEGRDKNRRVEIIILSKEKTDEPTWY